MTDNFKLNYPILKKKFAHLLDLVENKVSDNFQMITARSGAITARYQSILLHSSFDPKKEGKQFANSSNIDSGDHILLYGLGLGYHLMPILDIIGPSGKLLVVELNREILSNAFIVIDFTELLHHSNLSIISGHDDKDISEKLNNIFLRDWGICPPEKCKTLIHSPSFKCIPPLFTKFQNTLEMKLIEERTEVAWAGLEKNNYLINQEYVKNGSGIKELKGNYEEKPAFLVSAGPSLNRVLPFLNKLKKIFYIVAVDTSLPVLLKARIKPHFFVSIDPQDLCFNYISDYLEENIPIILTPTANPKTVRYYSGKKYFVIQGASNINQQEKEELIKEKGESKGGGSVSCIAVDVMIQMGFNPIVFVGQDCSFPGNRVYAYNTFEDEILFDSVNSNNTLDTISQGKVKEKKRVLIKNKFGEDTLSHQHLYTYLRYLEQIVRNYTGVTFYNWLSMGARVDGAIDIDSIMEIPIRPS